MVHASSQTSALNQSEHEEPPAKTPKGVPAAAALRARPDNAPHPLPQSTASRPRPDSPAPAAPASTSQPNLQPLRLHIATAAPPASDPPVAAKDHAPHPYFAPDTPQPHTAAAPLSLQSR